MSEPDDTVLLLVSFSVTGQWGTMEELWSRHDLEDVLHDLLHQHRLGECTGGGQGMGRQDIDLTVPSARWQAAWELTRSKLTELGLLGRATVQVYLADQEEPRQLWPPDEGALAP